MYGPGRTQSSGHKGHAIGGVRDEGGEGGKSQHQPKLVIWPSARSVYRIPSVTSRGAGEDLLGLLKSVQSLSQKYNKDIEYRHIAHYKLLHRSILFCQGDYRNSE